MTKISKRAQTTLDLVKIVGLHVNTNPDQRYAGCNFLSLNIPCKNTNLYIGAFDGVLSFNYTGGRSETDHSINGTDSVLAIVGLINMYKDNPDKLRTFMKRENLRDECIDDLIKNIEEYLKLTGG